jgi:peptidoglycan/LPS O-acetylase OafA/YrhL
LAEAKRVAGFDSIRLICALWVVFGHFGAFPLIEGIDKSQFIGWSIAGFYNNVFSGPAAVIIFFVISGFCINYPFRNGRTPQLLPYYSRRYIRILIPMALAIILAWPLGIKLHLLNGSILWSLLAEEIYYAIFPFLLILKKRFGWLTLTIAAYVLSIGVVLQDPGAGDYPSYGPYLNWLLGLPCWLLGCSLSERYGGEMMRDPGKHIWIWRICVLLAICFCSVLRFHSPVKYPWTLNFFAILVYFWLKREIRFYRYRKPIALLERNGKWSYSIYLMHLHGQAIYGMLVIPNLGAVLNWTVRNLFILIVCHAFYRLVEKPSHALAREAGNRILHHFPIKAET